MSVEHPAVPPLTIDPALLRPSSLWTAATSQTPQPVRSIAQQKVASLLTALAAQVLDGEIAAEAVVVLLQPELDRPDAMVRSYNVSGQATARLCIGTAFNLLAEMP